MSGDPQAARLRSWLAGVLFVLCGKLDPAYDVWLDNAPRREPGVSSREYRDGE